jgi:hypothetical protein
MLTVEALGLFGGRLVLAIAARNDFRVRVLELDELRRVRQGDVRASHVAAALLPDMASIALKNDWRAS